MNNLISIDREKCIDCQKCVGICPRHIFQRGEDVSGKQSPQVMQNLIEDCIHCGHCVCICPTSAIISNDLTPENSMKLDSSKLPTFEQFSMLVKQRRSIRKYKKDAVDEKQLSELLDLMRWAPTARNRLPLRWTIVNSWETVHEVGQMFVDEFRGDPKYSSIVQEWEQGVDEIHRGAPCLIFVTVPADYRWLQDASIAIETMDLAATALGLGACWAGLFINFVKDNQLVRHKLEIPDDELVCGALLLGYPDNEIYEKYPYRPKCPVTMIQ
ncbi:MAG: nitroreductase family protein [Planctomycetia bacterium]|nr:nitroreductase family protein [Planctomycetia bacterium]